MDKPTAFFPFNTLLPCGQEIRRIRETAGLTQGQLAEKAGVSRRWVNMLEQGNTGARIDKFMMVARALGLRLRFEPAPTRSP